MLNGKKKKYGKEIFLGKTHINNNRHRPIINLLGAVRPHVRAFREVDVAWTQTARKTEYRYFHEIQFGNVKQQSNLP